MKKEYEKELYFKGHLDCLYFYSKHIKELSSFIKGKEIAAKIHIPPNGVFLRRGSKDEPLFVQELNKKNLTPKFFDLRTKLKRHDAIQNKQLTKTQAKIWLYFPPNKPVEFFYATNSEHQNKPIERIFIDIDRRDLSTEDARKVAKTLIDEINSDIAFNKLIKFRVQILFTGSSYHVYLLLKKPVSHEFYEKYIAYSKNEKIPSFISKWANSITQKTNILVSGGHEKKENIIILDPSGTPSGKLARVPFSVHVKENKIDAVAELVKL